MKKILITILLLITTILVVGCETSEYDSENYEVVMAQATYDETVPIFIVFNMTDSVEFRIDCSFGYYDEYVSINNSYLNFFYDDLEINTFEYVEHDLLYNIKTITPNIDADIGWITDAMHVKEYEENAKYKCNRAKIKIPMTYTVYWNETSMIELSEDCLIFTDTENDEFDEWDLENEIREECFNRVWWIP
jgi:hypothetical protein